MKRNSIKILIITVIIAVTSCTKKLDLSPANALTNVNLFTSAVGYKQALAKVYSSMSLIGNNGATGSGDLPSNNNRCR